ncbi:hypothetical protein I302_101740 [Kwoniella bestiolae CBS 10118]|uniref:Metal iron transporter n=1 Tax=Kwoniella bestiolae CBS 10118 TaxID=1296100 RepID=A0A1B9GD35_9TREE|nr:metal iron transporter [Kwoniella bestiolae CBS 10118]OCF28926.1 metal iron transporter [Kwoniella bestiolae CBS 10118]
MLGSSMFNRHGSNSSKKEEKLTWKRCRDLVWRHMHFVGPGLVSSVAYIDPGNWATDLEAGATYGYKLLFIVLLAGLAAVVLQLLSVRLGAITSTSLPQQTRLLFIRLQAKSPKYRIPLKIALYTLYALAEIAIIGTDLAELLGSAIALHLLFPKLPLFAGVLITAVDVMIVLVFFRSNSGRQGMLFFEIVIVSLVLAVFVSFMILLKLTSPVWKDVFLGLVPSKTLVKPGALYIGVGIIGATVMPHALFLGSSLASVDRLNMLPIEPTPLPIKKTLSARMPPLNPFRRRRPHPKRNDSDLPTTQSQAEVSPDAPVGSSSRSNSIIQPTSTPSVHGVGKDIPIPLEYDEKDQDEIDYLQRMKEYETSVRKFDRIKWVDVHLLHSTIDTALSLLGFALTINSSILTLAGAAFYYGNNDASADDADLFGAFALIKSYIGHAAAIIFALALLCAGQSASITATLAGQVVSEGFINWKTSPLVRRLCTRLIGVIPAAVVASAVGPSGLNTMLVASQVLLSIVLPTVIFPLVYLCSKEEIMTVQGPELDNDEGGTRMDDIPHSQNDPSGPERPGPQTRQSVEEALPARRSKSYVSPKWVTILGYGLFGVVVLANAYVIVQLCLGNG